ncbi:hypothetical protein GB927_006225 [Shinella sp. CPCC 100929]|uniref:Uncharacterized protein n=1 Tax=Shinella lacus TaxID=2654216 RepID=A0ABT1R367_9HYPH|nr:hypothetical protein [Shinella lacus]MCQ4629626.1 hypothetical protein [Shinella lacus]
MSSDAKLAAISETDMQTIQSVLFRAGYDVGSGIGDDYKYSAAALLLMQKIRTEETSAVALEAYLDDRFGRSTKYKVLFAPLLPRYAIQGLPVVAKALMRPIEKRRRTNLKELKSWENEGGSTSGA